jgi:nucleotide-binding universal stress UspA family protein
MQYAPALVPPGAKAEHQSAGTHIVACVDRSACARNVVLHALAVASALEASVTLLRVLEAMPVGETKPDPIEWDLRRLDARESLMQIIDSAKRRGNVLKAEVIVGQTAEQICLWSREHASDFLVLGTCGESGPGERYLGSTVRSIVDRAPGSVLLVPPTAGDARVPLYRRILVPLDGSSRAESVVPLSIRLAAAADAELLIAHVIPVPEFTEVGPLEAEDLELRERITCRNERVAQAYLERLRTQIAHGGIRTRALLLRNGDVRGRLLRALVEESVDLIVLSAKGRSGLSGLSCGSVTAHLMLHPIVPLLIVSDAPQPAGQRTDAAEQAEVRLPAYGVA